MLGNGPDVIDPGLQQMPHFSSYDNSQIQLTTADGGASDPVAAANGYAIEARQLHKTYKGTKGLPDKQALKHVDLAVPKGSIFGLLGPNGAGKSTFINIFAGLVNKSGGTAAIWGHDIDSQPMAARASIGVVPQEINFDPFFTPREALDFQAGMYGVPKSQRRTQEILSQMKLADKADAYLRSLSGGMKRRLLVGKAMVHNPPVLVLDEPTAGVDIELRRQMWDYVLELNARGTTVVLTTHYLEEAEALCDTIAIINHGRVVACEPTKSLLSRIEDKTLLLTLDTPLTPGAPLTLDCSYDIRPDGRLAIPYSPRAVTVDALLAKVHEAGHGIVDLSTEESDLEDIFMSLTYGAPSEP